MIDESEILRKAAIMKSHLVKRADKIKNLSSLLGQVHAGMAMSISEDRAVTMQVELENAAAKQASEGLQFAVLRWVLGVTEDIEPDNLGLDL